MPSLSSLTDAAQPQDTTLPVEQPYSGGNLGPLQPVNNGVVGNTPVVVAGPQPEVVQALDRPEPMPDSVGTIGKIINRLTGANGEERYQLWPEKVVREALAAPHDAMTEGLTPPGLRREDVTDIPAPTMPTNDSTWLGQKLGIAPVAASPADTAISQAQAISALAGTGGLAGTTDATLGATPFLRPALKYGDKIYKAPVNGQHLDALPAHLAQDFQTRALRGDDIDHYNFGFMNHKGQFLDREKALDYAVKEGLVDPSAGQYGALTSTLLADSSKPGTAIEAMAKSNPREYMEVRKAIEESDPNYVYHITNSERADQIAKEGLSTHKPGDFTDQDVWPDGSTNKRNYFTPTPKNSWQFAPEEGKPSLLRIKKDSHDFKRESTGDIYSTKNVSPDKIEYLDHEGKWSALKSDNEAGLALQSIKQPFYSALEHNVNQISQSKMTGDQWLGTLANKPGVKPEEMDWTGVKDFLKERGNQPVTKAELQEHLQNNKVELKEKTSHTPNPRLKEMLDLDTQARKLEASGDTEGAAKIREQIKAIPSTGDFNPRYKDYQLPGGENYKEMLLTLPNKQQRHYEYEWFDPATQKSKQFKTEAEAKADAPRGAIVNPKEVATTNEAYRSSHWDEPNILAHVRMNDRIIDGKKSLHLEEIQSDWHQQGREKGYKGDTPAFSPDKSAELESLRTELKGLRGQDVKDFREGTKKFSDDELIKLDKWKRFNELTNEKRNSENPPGVPDAPFKKTWHELALKRMIREAAEKGYDRLSWTPGEAQAARYDLSKKLDTVRADPKPNGSFDLSGMKNKSLAFDQKNVPADKVADYVGKDIAEKLLKSEKNAYGMHELSGVDLKVGGEGMKGFYDQIIPKALSKISGEKVKTAELPGKLSNKMGQPPETHPVHYIDIPQALKDKAMQKGFPLISGNYMYTPVSGNPFDNKKKSK